MNGAICKTGNLGKEKKEVPWIIPFSLSLILYQSKKLPEKKSVQWKKQLWGVHITRMTCCDEQEANMVLQFIFQPPQIHCPCLPRSLEGRKATKSSSAALGLTDKNRRRVGLHSTAKWAKTSICPEHAVIPFSCHTVSLLKMGLQYSALWCLRPLPWLPWTWRENDRVHTRCCVEWEG